MPVFSIIKRWPARLAALGLGLAVLGCSIPEHVPVPPPQPAAAPNQASLPPLLGQAAEPEAVVRPVTHAVPAEGTAADSHISGTITPGEVGAAGTGETVAAPRQPPPLVLDLTTALGMAGGQNPRIALAAARYREAYARLESAERLWLPSLHAGVSFNHHEGPLQATPGEVLDVSRSSLQAGMGVQAVGAGTPVVPGITAQFHTADAVFQPRIATHAASADSAATRTATNDTLLATALAYLQLLRSTQELRIAAVTCDETQQLANLTATFARSGQGPQADADRLQTELVRRRNNVARAEEATRVAAVRLAEIISVDPLVEIVPQEPAIVPIDLIPQETPAADLLATALANRPELAEAQQLVCAAVARYRREKYAPLLPSLLLGVSQSGFGGGLGSQIDRYRGRFDFDAVAYWELRNLGLGERPKRDATRAQYDQKRAFQVQMMDRVAREVIEAVTQIKARSSQIAVAESGVQAATESYQRNTVRIRNGQGLPIEALQSLQALDTARREYLRTLADYNEAQFRLQRAIGWPINTLAAADSSSFVSQ